MAASRLDAVYRSILITKFFTKGWGKPENLRRLFEFRKTVSNRDECYKLIESNYPVTITKEVTTGDCRLLEGHFQTPLEHYLPGIVPPAAQKAHFQALIPLKWPQPDYRPMCLHLAGTGDHYFWRRRRLMGKPLLKEAGIGSVILENPFYGLRKPSDQVRSSLHNVSDIFVMGGCLILESLVLFHWCERNNLGPLGVTGLSMGGHMASLAATNWPKPLVLVPCLSWSTASAVFLQGVMSHSINWDLLEDQYMSDGVYREKLSKMVTIIDAAFLAGKKFARKVSESFDGPLDQTDVPNGTADTDAGTKNTREHTEVKRIKSGEELSIKPDSQADFDKFKIELASLLEAGLIRKSLYAKLTSNEKFELDLRDVEELNELNKKEMLSRVTNKYSIGSLINSMSYSTTSSNHSKEAVSRNAQNVLHRSDIEHPNPNIDNKKSTNVTQLNSTLKLDSAAREPNDVTKLSNATVESAIDKNDVANSIKAKLGNATTVENTIDKNDVANSIKAKLDSMTAQVDGDKSNDVNKQTNKKRDPKRYRNITEITSDIIAGLPFVTRSSGRKIDINKMHWRDREALQFMRGIMDECTHLSNFSVPFDTSLIIAVCAKHDAYVPRDDVGTLEEIWPGAEVRYVDAGHVSAYLLHQSMFRSCIVEAFERSRSKWKDGKHSP